jgi:ankyrin repeat protein
MILHLAAKKGDEKKTDEMLALGFNLEAKDSNGWTPFFSAALNRHREIVL